MRAGLVCLLVGAVLTGCAHAPTGDPARWERAFLWRIDSPPGPPPAPRPTGAAPGTKPSYLLGTMHAPDNRVVLFPDALTRALGAVAMVECELDMTAAKTRALQLGNRLFLPAGQTLEAVLPRALFEELRGLVEGAGADWATVRRMAPWAIMLIDPIALARAQRTGKRGLVLDSYLFEMAKRLHLEVGGIETIDEQFDAMAAVPMAVQVKMLGERVAVLSGRAKAAQTVDALKAAFFRGEGKTIMRNPAWQTAYGKLVIVDRNAKMVGRMVERLKQGRPILFAVGVAHLLGHDGLVARLERAGYRLTRVE
jgi:uncharacterized protein YbaP (TraB family)